MAEYSYLPAKPQDQSDDFAPLVPTLENTTPSKGVIYMLLRFLISTNESQVNSFRSASPKLFRSPGIIGLSGRQVMGDLGSEA